MPGVLQGRVVLTVSDNGPGIAAEDQDRVMERFVRLEESRSEPGTGLGLSLVKAVARLHGGDLRFMNGAPGLIAQIDLAPVGNRNGNEHDGIQSGTGAGTGQLGSD